MKKNTTILLATMAGMLFTNAVFSKQSTSQNANIKCTGGNACKGQSACQTATTACKGMNHCKGQGYIMTSAKDCKKKGGKVEE